MKTSNESLNENCKWKLNEKDWKTGRKPARKPQCERKFHLKSSKNCRSTSLASASPHRLLRHLLCVCPLSAPAKKMKKMCRADNKRWWGDRRRNWDVAYGQHDTHDLSSPSSRELRTLRALERSSLWTIKLILLLSFGTWMELPFARISQRIRRQFRPAIPSPRFQALVKGRRSKRAIRSARLRRLGEVAQSGEGSLAGQVAKHAERRQPYAFEIY